MRNRLINGNMRIDQRNAGAAVSPVNGTSTYNVDRWWIQNDTATSISAQQSTDVPAGAGFNYSVKLFNTTAANATSAQQRLFNQNIEGYNIADLMWGTAYAQNVTLSFWVKSSTTGTYAVAVENPSGSYSHVCQYTIVAANTWEYKTITVPGQTAGSWNTTNGAGIGVYFDLGCSTTQEGTAGWNTGDKKRVAGNVSLMSSANQAMYLTGVQLERGSTATTFDWRPFTVELQLCQRYYCKSMRQSVVPSTSIAGATDSVSGGIHTYSTNVSYCSTFIPFPVAMRTTPTLTFYPTTTATGSVGQWNIYNGTWTNSTSISGEVITENGFRPNIGGSWSANQMVLFYGGFVAVCEL